MDGQEGVGRTLLALAGVFVDVVAGRAGHAGRARLLRAQGAGAAGGGHAVHSVGHRDGVDLGHVIDELSALEREPGKPARGHTHISVLVHGSVLPLVHAQLPQGLLCGDSHSPLVRNLGASTAGESSGSECPRNAVLYSPTHKEVLTSWPSFIL